MKNNHHIKLPKVAIISDERFPHHATNTQQVIKNAAALHAAGLEVDMLIPTQAKGFFNPNYDVEAEIIKYYNIPKGLTFKTIPTIPASDYRIEKFTHFLAAPLYASLKKYDIIYTRNELAATFSYLVGKNVIFETYRRLGVEFPKAFKTISKWAQKPNFLGVVTHSKLSADSMIDVGMPAEKMLVLHNGYDESDMQPVLSKEAARAKCNLPKNDFYVVYTGNMQPNKGMGSIVELAALQPEIKFVMVGGRPEDLERLQGKAAEKNVQNIIWTGRQPIRKVSEYLYAADVLIIPPVSAPLQQFGRTVLPFKLFPYLASGRPILAAATADIQELLTHRKNAMLSKPDDVPAASAMLTELYKNPELLTKLGVAARQSGEQLTWDARANKFLNWLKNIDLTKQLNAIPPRNR
jgi:glycosyltransferase involved in cell wall biosynthesis